ncbi:hypothetical protein E2K98_03815 [Bacillus salipaludis]|uniref:DUF4025 domain-containing protein n=1 Tax=Bacillus salipaludis TaxID=2547811 RepID=A0A4R5VXR0_9BACI|nr:hypothetical protein [Bacillus salipaludis]MDQ6595139.1 hypothetical protein [Bacillus salipaludis]TDK64003.1 hypothetical protein E2K98_03815 [Bacillus salipaludis]
MAKNLYDEKSIEEAGLQEGQDAVNHHDREVDEDRMRRTASQYDNEKYQYQKSQNGGGSDSGYNIEQNRD